nr:CPPV167 ankyrin repeat protein [Cooks petrelpox virus]
MKPIQLYKLMFTKTDEEILDIIATLSTEFSSEISLPISPLHQAIHARRDTLVEKLLNIYNYDVNAKDVDSKYFPLHTVTTLPSFYEASYLLEMSNSVERYIHMSMKVIKNLCLPTSVYISLIKKAINSNRFLEIELLYEYVNNDLKWLYMDKGVYNISKEELITMSNDIIQMELNIANMLLSRGARVNEKDFMGCIPLHHAAMYGNNSMVKLLLQHGADTSIKSRIKYNAFNYAVASGNIDVVKLITLYFDDYKSDNISIIKAVNNQSIKVLRFLLEDLKLNVNTKKDNLTPLHNMVNISYNPDILKTLLENGADIEAKNEYNETPLHYAINKSLHCNELIFAFIMHGAKINTRSKNGNTPLHHVSTLLSSDDITTIISKHLVNDYTINTSKHIEIISRCLNDRFELAKTLIDNGAYINISNKIKKNTPLHNSAIHTSMLRITKILIDNGANINSPNKQGLTPLHIASKSSYNIPLIDKVLKVNAYIQKHSRDIIPDSFIIRDGTETVRLLIDNGADVCALDQYNKSPLHYAVWLRNSYKIAKILIHNGADMNIRDDNGDTPIFHAFHSLETTELLLDSGAKVNICNKNKITPLIKYVNTLGNDSSYLLYNQSKYTTIIKLLIKYTILEKYIHIDLDELSYTKNIKHINRKRELKSLKEECEKEVTRIQKLVLYKGYCLDSFFYYRNVNLLTKLISFVNDIDIGIFSSYKDILNKNIKLAVKRSNLSNMCLDKINELLSCNNNWFSLPVEIRCYIISFLDDNELRIILK